jgi:ribosome-binding protein aMBF1 (putative translation factor)
MLMPARKQMDGDTSVGSKAPAVNPATPGDRVRKLEDVALEIRRLREEDGLNITEIGEKLQVSYDVINQLILQSYKSVMNTPVVFETQENIRLGLS